MDVSGRTVFAIWIIGVLVTVITWAINLVLNALGITLSLTGFAGIFTVFILVAFIFGLIVHSVDEFVTEQKIDWGSSLWATGGMLWLIGIVATVLILVVTSFLAMFGLSLGFGSILSIVSTVLIIPLAVGFVCNRVDTWLTGD